MNIPTSRTSLRETIKKNGKAYWKNGLKIGKRTRLDPKETIRLGKSRSDSVGEKTLSIICTYEIFLVFRLYPISTFADSPIIPSLALKVFRVHR